MIRVLLAEDHAVVRTGLLQLLGEIDEFEVVGAATGGEEAVELAARERPHVVLMDLEMPGIDGIEATRRIRSADPAVNVVMLTAFSDRDRILDAVDAGAVGYLLKDAEPDELIRGLRAAARGESPLAPKAAQALVAARAAHRSEPDLTPREREVLGLLADGLPNKLIARRLEISEKTVKAHLTNIFQRIGVTDRTQAALWAQRHMNDGGETRD
jgi:DNA-binding NarL/FixJ family response regulator